MTDKQIIIDGVDVSGYLFYYDNGKCSAILGDDACKDWHNCSYKLQRQLDQLKATNEGLLSIQYKLADNNKQLRQTLTEIKEYCTDMKKDHYWGMRMMRFANEVLQIISEVEDV